jgi:ABC-type transport system involved in cytochrome bd biosynthesis fused ATPase/permease subunit
MGEIYETFRAIVKKCENFKKSTQEFIVAPYLELKQQFAKSFLLDFFVSVSLNFINITLASFFLYKLGNRKIKNCNIFA